MHHNNFNHKLNMYLFDNQITFLFSYATITLLTLFECTSSGRGGKQMYIYPMVYDL